MTTERENLELRLRTASHALDAAIAKLGTVPHATPEHTEWLGIQYACLAEQRRARSELDRYLQARACGR